MNGTVTLRAAGLADAVAIDNLVAVNLAAGHLLPRTLTDIEEHATRFLVAEDAGRIVGEFRADMLVNDHLLIAIKAALRIAPPHEAQLLNYLKATGIRLGLLLNFGPSPEFRRRVFS